jgi:PTS system mannose-specific IIA component
MIGFVLLAHGRLGYEFLNVLQSIVGPVDNIQAISFEAKKDLEAQTLEIEQLIKSVDTGSGVILVTDLFGGTPSNLAISFLSLQNVEVIAGMSLPMLLKLVSCRQMNLKDATSKAKQAAQQSIHVPSSILHTETAVGPTIAPVA